MMSQQMRSSKLEGSALEKRQTDDRGECWQATLSEEARAVAHLMAPDNNEQSRGKPSIRDKLRDL